MFFWGGREQQNWRSRRQRLLTCLGGCDVKKNFDQLFEAWFLPTLSLVLTDLLLGMLMHFVHFCSFVFSANNS